MLSPKVKKELKKFGISVAIGAGVGVFCLTIYVGRRLNRHAEVINMNSRTTEDILRLLEDKGLIENLKINEIVV